MLGFGIGAVLIGRLTDRFGIVPVILLGGVSLVVAVGFAWWVTRSITRPMADGLRPRP